jgi:hypothetical protein
VTYRLLDVIKAYFSNPGGYNLARAEDLIAEGHLSQREMGMLRRAIERYDEKVQATT